MPKIQHYILLQLMVLIAGFTGILGDLITVSADYITFYRTGIAFLSILLIGIFFKKGGGINRKQLIIFLGTGALVGLHWYTFFYSIKVSTVSVGVVCMSSMTLFTSFLEPLFFKRKFRLSELFLALLIICGLVMIFGFESEYHLGIAIGIASAFFASLFNTINGVLIGQASSFKITQYEMLGGFITLAVILLLQNKINADAFQVSAADWGYLMLLGIICTTFAFMLSVWLMKFLTPFTVSMSLNMEPVYTILIVLLIDYVNGTHKEVMSWGFYLGAAIIISAIITNAFLKRRHQRKKSALEKEIILG